jgi:sugar (glycoside-pentoside-hexuronide) transporter
MRGAPGSASEVLPARIKLCYALGDHSVNLALFALLSLFPFFLTNVAGLSAALAGAVPLIGRTVDAFTDPLMGRLSDATRWHAGRRRPFFLIGMLPFACAFAALWADLSGFAAAERFWILVALYLVFTVSSTVLSVPYLALIPEMSSSYDERTSINAYRGGGAILGALAALAIAPLAGLFGGGPAGWARAGLVAGLYVLLPWPIVWRFTFERRHQEPAASESFLRALVSLARHRAYAILTGLFLLGRIAIDLSSAMFLFYFTFWLGRPGDYTLTLGILLAFVVVALPGWLALAPHVDKRTIFLLGACSWVGSQAFLFLATPSWPRWTIFAGAALAGAGYAAADMIPWSMLGEVVDEDELRSGERREGLYFGLFTFLRKLGGAGGVALGMFVLDLSGFAPDRAQSPATLATIRYLTAVVPGILVVLAGAVALGYPISRGRHAEILAQLAARRGRPGGAAVAVS